MKKIIDYFNDNLKRINYLVQNPESTQIFLKEYYKRITLYINYINFVYSGFIFEHSLYYETRYKGKFFSDLIKKIMR